MQNTKFIFVRHAESCKNLNDITGGTGAELTENGIAQAYKLCKKISKIINDSDGEVISSSKIQAIMTGQIIAKELGLKFSVTEKLIPASMGIIDGMSNEEISTSYPAIYEQLRSWRNQEIEACELVIEGMESPVLFWKRMENYLHSICDGGIKIVVCTRSILVFLYNYIHGNTPLKGGGYKHTSFSNCDILVFSINPFGKVCDWL